MTHDRDPAPASREGVARARALAERRLSPEEFEAYVSAPFSQGELEGNWELIAWFSRRYPTPLERLDYARRACRRSAESVLRTREASSD